MTDDQSKRLAQLAARGIAPHPFSPGQMRRRRTICGEPNCGGFETDTAHDPDLIRLRPRKG